MESVVLGNRSEENSGFAHSLRPGMAGFEKATLKLTG
jgi:hypothetical protein